MLAKGAMMLARNPKVRAAARYYGTLAANNALYRVQQRRSRRGKKRYLPAVSRRSWGTRGPQTAATESRSAVPVRVNTVMKNQSGAERVAQTETTLISVGSYEYEDHEADVRRIAPQIAALWPLLSQKSHLYTGYEVRRLVFKYMPIVGSSYSGQVVMGFSMQSQKESTDYNGPGSVWNMPVFVTGSANSEIVLNVPTDKMSLGGKSLLIEGGGMENIELSKYYVGNFAILPYDCQDAGTLLGKVVVSYDIVLKDRQMDDGPTGGLWNLVSGLVKPGHINLREVEMNAGRTEATLAYTSVRRCVLMVSAQGTTGALTPEIDGTEIPAKLSGTISGGLIGFFPLGRRTGEKEILVTASGDYTITSLTVVDIPDGVLPE